MALPGWGTLVGRIAQWFPSRKEKLINDINKTKALMYELQQKPTSDKAHDVSLYTNLADKLSKLEKQLQTIDA